MRQQLAADVGAGQLRGEYRQIELLDLALQFLQQPFAPGLDARLQMGLRMVFCTGLGAGIQLGADVQQIARGLQLRQQGRRIWHRGQGQCGAGLGLQGKGGLPAYLRLRLVLPFIHLQSGNGYAVLRMVILVMACNIVGLPAGLGVFGV